MPPTPGKLSSQRPVLRLFRAATTSLGNDDVLNDAAAAAFGRNPRITSLVWEQ